jgi:hypothetical protein
VRTDTNDAEEVMLMIPRYTSAVRLLIALLVIGLCHAPALGQVKAKLIGCFTDVKASAEHAKGYSVRLWSGGSEWFGVVDRFEGPPFDPPMGLLEEIRHADTTGAVSFKAKMSFGLGASGPTRELVIFSGVLDKVGLRGTFDIEHLDAPPAVRVQRETVVLRRAEQLCDDREYADRAAWWRIYEPILRARGPKW